MSEPRERILHLTRDDFTWQYFRAGGKGGQNQNKRDTGVRCIHVPSGARGESREHRTQAQNRREAFVRCAKSPAFRNWVRIQHADIAAMVDREMADSNLLVEYGPFE